MLALGDNPDFRRLWLGQLTSVFGTWLLVVAVPLHVFDVSGSTTATGATFVAETLPALALGPAAGVLVDRWDRRRVMIVSDVVRGLAVMTMVLALTSRSLWILFAALLVENGAAQFFRPARSSIIPSLVGSPAELCQANACFAMIDGLVRLVGSILGSALYLTVGFTPLVLLDAASYLVSAIACHRVRHRTPRRTGAPAGPRHGLFELRDGLRHVRRDGPLRRMLRVTAAFYLANGAVTALLVPYWRTELRLDSGGFGYLLTALGIGYVVGTVTARRIIDRLTPGGAVSLAVPLMAACYLLAFQPRELPLTLLGFAGAGAPAVLVLVAVQTECQRRTPDRLLGRATAAFLTVEMAVSVLGAALGSLLAAQAGILSAIDCALLVLATLGLTLTERLPRPRSVGRGSVG